MKFMFEGTRELNDYVKTVLQRDQELFKLLDWYLAQNIYYRKKRVSSRIRNKLYRNRILELSKKITKLYSVSQPRPLTEEDRKRILSPLLEEE
ncbi:hypothetical protein LCGC14_0531540 [marine sediment metagenome]|uniref:Uncharacterized protein n=1 Tax=marine sediment metagenome TaxID=412755 RepID=A0A0F9V3N5_9ZZZZ